MTSGEYQDLQGVYVATLTDPPRAEQTTDKVRVWHYRVRALLGTISLDGRGLDSWLLLYPNGIVEAAAEPIDDGQVYRDETVGGPSWLCKPIGGDGGPLRPTVFTVYSGRVIDEDRLVSLGFKPGEPDGVKISVNPDRRLRGDYR